MVHILYAAPKSEERARIAKRLRAARLNVHLASSCREALAYLRHHMPQVAVVEILALSKNPVRLFNQLRRSSPGTVFIIVTEGETPNPVPEADAHLRKPFTTRTFKRRLKAALDRRAADVVEIGRFVLDVRVRRLITPNGTYHLTPVETALMREFLTHPNEVLPREYLMRAVWGTDYWQDSRTLDVHVHWLRRKIEMDAHDPQYILTVYGVGYLFDHGSEE